MMAKRKKSNIKFVFALLEIALAVVAFFMLFLPALVVKNSETTYSAAQIAFGYKENINLIISKIEVVVFKSSFMAMLPYLLLIVAAILAVLKFIVRSLNSKLVKFIMLACFAVAGVLLIFYPNFVIYGAEDGLKNFFENFNIKFETNPADTFNVAFGSILGIILSFLGAAVSVGDLLSK